MNAEITTPADRTAVEAPETTHGGRIYRPLTDIVETGTGVSLMLEMPGVAPDDVDISLERRVLTIRGRTNRPDPENLQLVHAEYGEGDYERVFTMSEDFDPEKIEAGMRNGVLTVTLPRAAATLPKKIVVKTV
ncbi:MAG: Hsp20/alpha crystallin family protein [Pseudomonadota bacterium]